MMGRKISAWMASPIGNQKIEPVIIEINIPSDRVNLGKENFEADADVIFEALVKTLPGGTLDRLAVKMLEHQVGILKVSYWDGKND